MIGRTRSPQFSDGVTEGRAGTRSDREAGEARGHYSKHAEKECQSHLDAGSSRTRELWLPSKRLPAYPDEGPFLVS